MILFLAQPPHLRDQRRIEEGQLDAIPDVLGPLVQALDQARLVAGALDRERRAELRHGPGDRRQQVLHRLHVKFLVLRVRVSTHAAEVRPPLPQHPLDAHLHRRRRRRAAPAGALQSEDHVLRVWFHFHHGHVAAVRDEVGPHPVQDLVHRRGRELELAQGRGGLARRVGAVLAGLEGRDDRLRAQRDRSPRAQRDRGEPAVRRQGRGDEHDRSRARHGVASLASSGAGPSYLIKLLRRLAIYGKRAAASY